MTPGKRSSIDLEGNKFKCYAICTPDKLCVTAITDPEYPERAAFGVLYELFMDFVNTYKSNPAVMNATVDNELKYKKIEELLARWQKPEDSKY